jgi:protein kinase-like protein
VDAPGAQGTAAQTPLVLAGRYRLGEILGSGGMAEVFDAIDERLGRPVAVKILRAELATDPDLRRRFEAEARAAARLTHPHVVAVYDTGEDRGRAFIVMERLPGDTLATAIARGPVGQAWLRSVALDVLDALAAAHDAGIVHRDIKPGNILLDPAGSAKVGDFGIAKSVEGLDVALTRTGVLIGTPAYLPPERVDGATATPQSDIYGLGVVMYEALSGHKPFVGTDPLAVAYAARHIAPPALETVGAGVAPELAAVVSRAMAIDPGGRWPSAVGMAAALRAIPVESLPDAGPPPGVPRGDAVPTAVQPGARGQTEVLAAAPLPAGSPSRRRWWAGAGLVAGFLALALLLAAGPFSHRAGSPAATVASTTAAPTTTSTTIDPVAALLNQVADGLGAPDDGAMAADLADGLRQVAATSQASRPAAATSLLAEAAQWRHLNLLSGPAYDQASAALLQAGASPPPTSEPPKRGKAGGGGGGD